MHAVVALELRVIGNGVSRRSTVVVCVQPHRLIEQREEEQIGVRTGVPTLTRAVHVGHAVGTEALSPVVPAAGLGGVDQGEGLAAIRRRSFLVEVDGHIGNVRSPAGVDQERGIIERPSRGINDLAVDAAGLAGDKRLLAELEEAVLAREALPAFRPEPEGRINSASGATRATRCKRNCGVCAVRIGAIVRSGYTQW